MDFQISKLLPLECERLINSVVVPRPIAWVSSQDCNGIRNLAPFSYFNLVSVSPALLVISFRGPKDTLKNIEGTGQFVVNVVSRDLSRQMVASSEAFPPEIDEIAMNGLETFPSRTVLPPRLAMAKAALECKRIQSIKLGDGTLIVGEILNIFIDEAIIVDGHVSVTALSPVGRLGGAFYATPDQPFRIDKN
jgi:flavin reductase (DIM6/NTAB) family NADH-FMN oxidoreductase RutF